MPTYRVPVRVAVKGYVVLETEDPVLALFALPTVDTCTPSDLKDTELLAWVVDGEPEEVEP